MDHIHYNLLKEPWIEVTYLNGKTKTIGIRQALQDAHQIKDIEVPTFHGLKSYTNEMLIIRLLSNIVMAAFMRGDQESMRNDYILKLLTDKAPLYDNERIIQYLEDYESRFDIFDDVHPFMQDINLKDNKEFSENYRVVLSPYSPGDSTKIFGKTRSGWEVKNGKIKAGYNIGLKELAYALISNASVAGKPSSKQYSSIMNKASLFTVLKGSNLKETILFNCIALSNSSEEDRPVWEFASIDDAYNYSGKDVLACEYFPSKTVYIYPELDANGYICKAITTSTKKGESRGAKEDVLPPYIADEYVVYNPFTIKTYINKETDAGKKKPEAGASHHSYKQYCNTNDAWLLSVAATNGETINNTVIASWKKLSSKLKRHGLETKVLLDIFYRELDDKKNLVQNDGKIVVPNIDCLLTESGYALAVFYEEDYKKIRTVLRKAVSARFKNINMCEGIANTAAISLSSFAEHYFYTSLYVDAVETEELRKKAFTALKSEAIDIFNRIQGNSDPVSYTTGYKQLRFLTVNAKKK